MIDGKDFVNVLKDLSSELRLTKKGKSNHTSRNIMFKHGGKVIFLDDVIGFPMVISEMYGANEIYDGHVMTNMRIYTVLDASTDCIIYYHHLDFDARKMIEKSECNFGSKNLSQRNHFLRFDQNKKLKKVRTYSTFRRFSATWRNS